MSSAQHAPGNVATGEMAGASLQSPDPHKGGHYISPLPPRPTPDPPYGGQEVRTHLIPQSLFLRQPNAELRYLLGTEQGSTIERLHAYLAETSPQERRFAPLS